MGLKSLIPATQRLRLSDPFGAFHYDLERVLNEISRGFHGLRSSELFPRVDVTETDEMIEVTAELPGLEEKDVEVNFTDDVLTIKGEKKSEKEESDKNRRISERTYGSFFRSIQLPGGVDPAKIEASIAKGILTVKAPKPAPSVSQKIEIKKSE